VWGPGRLAGTPRGNGDAREVKACATEARGTKRSSASGCGEWPASLAAAPSCHERRFFGERDHPRSCEKLRRFDSAWCLGSEKKPRGVVVGADETCVRSGTLPGTFPIS
jgi:hypothetical protein